ncbi:hypothetical protein ACJQ62_004509 [Yersinia enterocolitica]
MENHYEYLKLDMSASIDEIRDALELNKNNDEARMRKIKSILLNERFKNEYDEKLISHLINDGKSSNKIDEKPQNLYIEKIKNIDNGELHNLYIYAAFFLLVLNFSLSLLVSTQVGYVISFIVTVLTIFVLYKDWKILEKNNLAVFSKWWSLIPPVYLFKRSNAKKESKKLFSLWMAIIIIFVTSSLIFANGKSAVESAACGVVSDIYRTQFHQPGRTCKSVTITESEGKNHYGIAEISDGSVKSVTIKELSDGQIYVTVE